MKRLFCLLILLSMICHGGYAQSDFQRYQLSIDSWVGLMCSPVSETKGKMKIVDLSEKGYLVQGLFSKGILEAGTTAEFYLADESPFLFLKGKVSYTAGHLHITGVKYDCTEEGISETYGVFAVSNYELETMNYKGRRAGRLSVQLLGKAYYKSSYQHNPVIVDLSSSPGLAMENHSADSEYDWICAPLSPRELSDCGYSNLKGLLMLIDVRVKMAKGSEIFQGLVIPEFSADSIVHFRKMEGEMLHIPGFSKVSVSRDNDGLTMTKVFDSGKRGLIKEVIHVEDAASIADLWSFPEYYQHAASVELYYQNGDCYEGQIALRTKRDVMGNGFKMTDGKYIYSNGDIFEGNLDSPLFLGLPTDGRLYLIEESRWEKGDWARGLMLDEKQIDTVTSERFPSLIYKKAQTYHTDNHYQRLLDRGKECMDSEDYDIAVEVYQAAGDVKPDAAEWKENLSKAKSSLRKQLFTNEMVNKYGEPLGSKIARMELEVGMTKNMVEDAFSFDPTYIQVYNIRTYSSWSDIIEVWEFDKEKMMSMVTDAMGEDAFTVNAFFALGSLFGLDVEDKLAEDFKYKYIKFKNGVVQEIRDYDYSLW